MFRKSLDKIYILLIFFYLMLGTHAWFIWFLEDSENSRLRLLVMSIFLFFNIIYIRLKNIRLNKERNIITGLVCLVLAIEFSRRFTPTSFITTFIFVFPIWVLLSIDLSYETIKKKIVNWLAFIIIPGLIIHLYILKEGLLPGIPYTHPNNSNYLFFNYLFTLKSISDLLDPEGLRFQSIFLEPGFLGTFIAFVLYAIRFNFRKYKWACFLLVAQLFSLSLAGYVLTFIGYVLVLGTKKNALRYYLLGGIAMFLIVIFSKTYNDGDNYLNNKIFERLEYDEDAGIKGNNRVGNGAEYYFEQALMDGSFVLGLGEERIVKINGGKGWEDNMDYENQIRGAGYKIFILKYGLVSAIFFFLAYYFIGVSSNKKRRYALGYLLIVFVTFLQAAYPDSYSWLIPFILGTKTILPNECCLNQQKKKKEYEHTLYK